MRLLKKSRALLLASRSAFHRRARIFTLGLVLLGGALAGVPMTPEEIEEHMRIMSEAEIVLVLEDEDRAH